MTAGNILASIGEGPTVLERANATRANNMQNRLGEMQIAQAQAEMQQGQELKSAYARLAGGDQSALMEISGLNPELGMSLQKHIAERSAEEKKKMQEENDRAGELLLAARGNPQLRQQLNIESEEMLEQQIARQAFLSSTLAKSLVKEQTPTNVSWDDSGQAFGVYGNETRALPGEKKYVRPPTVGVGAQGNGLRVNKQRYFKSPTEYVEEFDDGSGVLKFKDQNGNTVERFPTGYEPEASFFTKQRVTRTQDRDTKLKVAEMYNKDVAPINEIERNIAQLEATLLAGGPVASPDVTKALGNIIASGQRAMAELRMHTNPGDLFQRIGASAYKFGTGELPDYTKAEIHRYLQELRQNFINPGKDEIYDRATIFGERMQTDEVNPVPAPQPFTTVPDAQQTPPGNVTLDYTKGK